MSAWMLPVMALLFACAGVWFVLGMARSPREGGAGALISAALALAAGTFASNILSHAALLGPAAVQVFSHELLAIFVLPLMGALAFAWAVPRGHGPSACLALTAGVTAAHGVVGTDHAAWQWLLSAGVLLISCVMALRLAQGRPPLSSWKARTRRKLAVLLLGLGLTVSHLLPETRAVGSQGGHDIMVLSGLIAASGLLLLYLYFFRALGDRGLGFWRMLGAIVAAELGIMLLLPVLLAPDAPAWLEAVSDGALLSLFLVPLLRRERRVGLNLGRATRRLRYESDLQQAVNTLLALRLEGMSLEGLVSHSLETILALSWLPVEPRAGIFLREADGGLRLAAQRNLSMEVRENCARIRPGYCLCGRAAATGRLLFKSCLDAEHEFRHAGMGDHGHYNVPLNSEGGVEGVLVIYLEAGHRRRQWEADALLTLARTVGELISRKRLNDRQRLAQEIVNSGAQGVMVTDADLRIVEVNPAFSKVTGYAPGEVMGKTPGLLKSGRHDADFYRVMWAAIEQDGSWQGEIWNRRKDGTVYPEWLTITRLDDGDGQRRNYIGVFTDLTAIKQAEGRIEALAYYDTLTGLANRNQLLAYKAQALARAQRSGHQVALLFIDLDRFKIINDSFGHAVGDAVLKALGGRIESVLRKGDLAARLGGDEFVVLLESDGDGEVAVEARRVAGKLLAVIAAPIRHAGHEFHLTASIGIALYPEDAERAEDLLQFADATMYLAKRQEPGQYRFFSHQANAGLRRRVQMEAALREAISRGELELHYQPKYRLQDHTLIGAEALLRWHSAELGAVSPAEFIPLAEESALILELGTWVLEEACRQKRAWLDEGLCAGIESAHVAINIAARQLQAPGFAAQARAVLERHGLEAGAIQLELTETGLMKHSEIIVKKLRALKEAGFSLAIDDFGTGYSSLARLKDFPIDLIKIDRAFVRDITTDAGDAAIVRATIEMGRALGISICAEGPETQEQIDYLRQYGCDYAQGYFFSRPLPATDIEAMLREISSGAQRRV